MSLRRVDIDKSSILYYTIVIHVALSLIVSGPPEGAFLNPDRCGRVPKVYNGGWRKGTNRPPEVSNPDQPASKSAQRRTKTGLPILPNLEKRPLALAPRRFWGLRGYQKWGISPTLVYYSIEQRFGLIVAISGHVRPPSLPAARCLFSGGAANKIAGQPGLAAPWHEACACGLAKTRAGSMSKTHLGEPRPYGTSWLAARRSRLVACYPHTHHGASAMAP